MANHGENTILLDQLAQVKENIKAVEINLAKIQKDLKQLDEWIAKANGFIQEFTDAHNYVHCLQYGDINKLKGFGLNDAECEKFLILRNNFDLKIQNVVECISLYDWLLSDKNLPLSEIDENELRQKLADALMEKQHLQQQYQQELLKAMTDLKAAFELLHGLGARREELLQSRQDKLNEKAANLALKQTLEERAVMLSYLIKCARFFMEPASFAANRAISEENLRPSFRSR